MPIASVTRLRLRSWLEFPSFAWAAFGISGQTARATGFLGGQILNDRGRTFWTLTIWQDDSALRDFMLAGPHGRIMPKLTTMCDEASLARWPIDDAKLPSWETTNAKLHEIGRASRVKFPSPRHKDLAFPPPTVGITRIAPLAPKRS